MFILSILIVCIAINSCLSAFEMALVSVKPSSLRFLMDKGSKKAEKILAMRQRLEQTLSTVQVGITIVAIASGSVVGDLTALYGKPFYQNLGLSGALAESLSTITFVLIVTYVTVVFGELVPKSIAARYPTSVVYFFFRMLQLMTMIFRPFVVVFEASTIYCMKLIDRLGPQINQPEHKAAEDAFPIHKLSSRHRQYVFNLIHIQTIPLSKVLRPWNVVVKINQDMTADKVRSILAKTGHTRVPICKDQEVIGLLNAKEFFALEGKNWQSLIKPIIHVSDLHRPLNVLRILQSKHSHMAIVKSEQHGILGVVTIEDIIEEIVGDIFDEDDSIYNPKDISDRPVPPSSRATVEKD